MKLLAENNLKRYTDAELLEKQFKVNDPEDLKNLSMTLPKDYKSAEIEFWYNVRPPSGKLEDRPYVWCAHDGKATHWKGYVMKSSSNIRFLIGAETCGQELYGLDFNIIEKNFKALGVRQHYLSLWNSTVCALPDAIYEISEFMRSPVLKQFTDMRMILDRDMEDLYDLIKRIIIRNEGRLLVDEKVRDFDAELRRDDKYNQQDEEFEVNRERMTSTAFKVYRREYKKQIKERQESAMYKFVQKEIGTVAGADFVHSSCSPIKVIARHLKDIKDLHLCMTSVSTDDCTDQALKGYINKLQRCIAGFEDVLKSLRSALDFFEKKNLETLGVWVSKQRKLHSQYKFTNKSICNSKAQLALPSNYQMPMSFCSVEKLKVAMTRAN